MNFYEELKNKSVDVVRAEVDKEIDAALDKIAKEKAEAYNKKKAEARAKAIAAENERKAKAIGTIVKCFLTLDPNINTQYLKEYLTDLYIKHPVKNTYKIPSTVDLFDLFFSL